MGKYTIREDGNNGSVEVERDDIVRTHKRRLGRDDKVKIPVRMISSVDLDRQVGGDVVTVQTPGATYEWKLADDDAAKLVAEIELRRKD